MSAFDTFIQAGGAGINLPGIVNQAQVAKQNDLLLLNAPKVEARAAAQENRLQNQENRLQNQWETIDQLRQGSRLLNYIDNESPDIKGAMAYISEGGVTEKEKPTLALFQKALESGDLSQVGELRNALIGLKKTALEMGDVKAQGGDGTAHMQDDAHLQALIRQYGVDSPRVQQFYDVLRQNYSWQNMGNVPTPARIGASGPQIGGQAPTQENPSGVDNRTPAQITMENARNVEFAKGIGAKEGEGAGTVNTATDIKIAQTEAEFIADLPTSSIKAAETISKLGQAMTTIDDTAELSNEWTSGYSGKIVAFLDPTSDAAALKRKAHTLKSQAILTTLAQMRELAANNASGLGNTNEREIITLETDLANLDPDQDPEELRKALTVVTDKYTKVMAANRVTIDLAEGVYGDLRNPKTRTKALEGARKDIRDVYLRPALTGQYAMDGKTGRKTAKLKDGTWVYVDNGEAW